MGMGEGFGSGPMSGIFDWELVPRSAGSYSEQSANIGLSIRLGPGSDSGLCAGWLMPRAVE